MYHIEWTDDNSVGVVAIDDQHKELVSITNRLFQAIMDDKGFSVLMDILIELEKYVDVHFSFEEELLKRHGYPQDLYEEHAAEHVELTQQVKDFVNMVEEAGETLDMEVFDFLRTWTDSHLSRTDMKYKLFLQSKGVS